MKQDQEIMTYKLMIKQHYETGIQYLCVTKRKNWKDYKGSGKRWKNLLTAHPQRILTMLVYTDNDVSRFDEMCRFWSDDLDVVNNENFANLVPEYGYEGNVNNFAQYYTQLNEADRISFVERRTASIRSFYNTPEGELSKIRRKETQTEIMSDLSARKNISDKMTAWYADPANAEINARRNIAISIGNANPETKKKKSDAQKENWKDPVFREQQQKAISSGRLAMQQEAKQLRSERVAVAFQQSESRQSFISNMKVDRLGNNNPNAIEIIWDGLHFSTFKDFNQYVKTHGMNLRTCREILKQDKDPNRRRILKSSKKEKQITMLTCMYCDKISMQAHSSAFNRWHNNNCKHKGK